MKKLLFILLLIVLFSCEKEDELFCWTCQTTYGEEVISTIVTCGMPESDIKDFEIGIESGISCFLKGQAETNCVKRK